MRTSVVYLNCGISSKKNGTKTLIRFSKSIARASDENEHPNLKR